MFCIIVCWWRKRRRSCKMLFGEPQCGYLWSRGSSTSSALGSFTAATMRTYSRWREVADPCKDMRDRVPALLQQRERVTPRFVTQRPTLTFTPDQIQTRTELPTTRYKQLFRCCVSDQPDTDQATHTLTHAHCNWLCVNMYLAVALL